MLKRILQSIFTRLSVSFINLLVLLISSRYLGVSSRGEISLFLFNIAVLQILAEIVTGYHLVHFTNGQITGRIYLFGQSVIVLISVLGNLFLYLTQNLIAGFELEAVVLTILVLVNTFHCVLLLCLGKLFWFNRLSLFQPLLFLGLMLAAIFLFSDYTLSAFIHPLLLAFALSALISGLFLLTSVRKNGTDGQSVNLKALVKNGMAGQAALLLFAFGNKLSYYFMGTGAELGLYASTCQLAESVLIPVSALLPVYFSEIYKKGTQVFSPFQLQNYLCLSLWFCFTGLVILNLIPEYFYLGILGYGFKDITQVLMLYSFVVPFMALYFILSNFYSAQGKSVFILKNNLLAFLFTSLLTPVLVPEFHIPGAIVVALISYLIMAARLYYVFIRSNHLKFSDLFNLVNTFRALKRT